MTEPPGMLRRPSDPGEPLLPLRSSDAITTLHAKWARIHAAPSPAGTLTERLKRKARALAGRVEYGRDDRLQGDLIRAVDAVAGRCDELSERVQNLEVTVEDLARILGEEVTRLRAAVEDSDQAPPDPSQSRQ